MIAKFHRFHGHGSLRYVYQNGETVRGPLCSLKFIRNERRKHWRLAVVVSKKVHKSAVRRNRIRRRIYETARLHLTDIPAYDMVLTVFHEQMADMPHDELVRVVTAQLKQARILVKKPKPEA